ncbi:hypothetical protein GCM10023201_26050 [Actinomycetospora corticicola]|uniref:Uncharacterized protein n=1 Tax=Actinomycetospora corticicola TaxID=663602 RepID=A0A7Y9DXK4_9PSEU|nr:hypothetical protein [Actinomycetospora corticicola]NYD37261.1 hypothetical protein [Actinomycetospora corticicola]
MTTPTDRSVTPLVVTVLAGYALLAYAAVAPTLNLAGALLGLVLALAVLGLQVGYVSRPGVVHPREGVVVALLALACLVYVPIVAIGVGWIGFAGFLAGSLRILLPPRVGLAGLAVVVVSVGVLAGLVAGAPLFTVVTSAVSTLVTGLVVHGLTRWWQYTGSARPAPVLPAPPAAAGESASTETTPVETTSAVATPQGVGSEPAGGTADGDDADGGKADGGGSDATDAGGSAEGGSAAGGDGPAGSAEVSGVADGGTADGGTADGGKADGGKADGGKADKPADPAADRWADALRTARSDLDTAGVELTVLGADVELPDEIAAPFVELLRVAVAHTTRSPAATTCRVSVVRRATEARIVVTHDGATDDPDPEDFEPLGERFEDRDGSVLAERDDAEFTVDGRLPLPA